MPPIHPDDPMEFDPHGPGREPLTQGQVDGLTQALNDLTMRVQRQTETTENQTQQQAGQRGAHVQPPADTPWWFKFNSSGQYPGSPSGPPPGSAAARAAGWSTPNPLAEDFTYVRSYFRRKPTQSAAVEDDAPEPRRRRASAAAGGIPPNKPPWWNRYTSAAEPPNEGPPDPEGWFKWRNFKVPTVTDGRMPWNRKRKQSSWQWRSSRRAGAWARSRLGKRAGKGVRVGLATAASRIATGWSPTSAARAGVFAGTAAAGPWAVAVVGLSVAAVKATEALNQLTRDQLVYNRSLGEASAQMRMVFVERDIQELMRNRERGDRLAGSARTLTQAEQFKEDQTKEIGILWERTKNELAAGWETFKGLLFFQMNQQAGLLNKLVEGGDNNPVKALTMGQWAEQLSAEARAEQKRRDPKWEPPKVR